jgi:hypothetical protein
MGLNLPGRNYIDCDKLTLTDFVAITIAQLNAGATQLVAGKDMVKILPHSVVVEATGSFAGLTDVRIQSDATTPVVAFTVVAANLDAKIRSSENEADGTVGAGMLVAGVAGKGLQVAMTGATATGGTSLRVKVRYSLIPAAE